MSISIWKASLDDIAEVIRVERQAFDRAKARISAASSNLALLPTTHADIITEIQSLGDDPSEVVAKDELVKLTAEFVALKTSIDAAITALN